MQLERSPEKKSEPQFDGSRLYLPNIRRFQPLG